MKSRRIGIACAPCLPFLLLACAGVTAADEPSIVEERYVPVDDPLVAAKLAEWQDLKFGLLMHWGPYSQWGVVESWSLCGEDEGRCQRKGDDYEQYRRDYENLKTTFDPTGFEPERWARAAKEAGMRYVVFTTKHHDGVHMLVDIVAKGGNLLLNVAPGPEGKWQDGAYELLAGIGAWMDVNGDAIYGSKARAPYKRDGVCVVDGADGAVYAIVLAAEGEDAPPAEVVVPGVTPAPDARIELVGTDGSLAWRPRGDDVVVEIPATLRVALPCAHAWTLRIPD